MIRESVSQQRERNLMKWVAYWRLNPHRFVKEYLGINLKFYQVILFYMMGISNWFMYIAARGQGKSFIVAVYALTQAILYPGTKIVIASGTKGQATLIISAKIVELYNDHVAVRNEIGDFKNISTSVNRPEVKFPNGSKISAEVSNDNSRGLRCNILILDEFRMIDKEVVDKVFKPMLNVYRQPLFLNKPGYENYPKEKNKQIYISSAWYKTHWIWGEFKRFLAGMLDGRDYTVVSIPWQTSVRHGLLPLDQVLEERESDEFDEFGFTMEYDALFVGENERGYFKLDAINKCRTLDRIFIPPTNLEYVENKSKSKPRDLSNMKRRNFNSEIRIIGLDVALMGRLLLPLSIERYFEHRGKSVKIKLK